MNQDQRTSPSGGLTSSAASASPHTGERSPQVLLTEGSSLSARQTLYALGGWCTIDLLDPAPFCLSRFSRFVRRKYTCPAAARDPQGYLRCLVERLQATRYDVLLPTHEQTYLLSRFRESLARRVGLALPEFAALEQLQSKAAFTRLLQDMGIPHPQTEIVRRRVELESADPLPCYVKLAHSTAGGGVFYAASREDLARIVMQLDTRGLLDGHHEILIQQPARGVQATAQAVFQDGRLVGFHCFEARALGVGGMSTARVSAAHPVVLEHVKRIGEHLAWHGAFFLDYYYDAAAQRPEYIEANPRIGETVNAMLSGVNLGRQLVRVSLGEQVEFQTTQQLGVRTDSSMMILISEALEGQGRGVLWQRLRENLRGEGLYQESADELTRWRDDWLSVIPAVATALQLLAWPRAAHSTVNRTVDYYSIPEATAEIIRQMPEDTVERLFAQHV